MQPPIPKNEFERLKALHSLQVLDTDPEEVYDRITRIASELFNVPMALVCFVDENRVWFKSKQGVNISEVSRDDSICGHAISKQFSNDPSSRIFEIPDTTKDPRFSCNNLVVNKPGIRYYMGFVLQSKSNENLGTLCIMDTKPREYNQNDKNLLIDLGRMVDEALKDREIANNFSINDIEIASSITYKVFDELDTLLSQKGINLTEWKVLNIVLNSNFATPSHVAKQLDMVSSKVSKLLEHLEDKGFIRRIRSIENCDRRLVKLECNDEGREIWNYGKQMSEQIVGKYCVQ